MKHITKEQAHASVAAAISQRRDGLPPEDELILVEDATVDKPWGWVFFYTSKKWKETADLRYAIAGNAPIIVEKETGRLIETGTARDIEYYIENYERTGDPAG